MKIETFWCWLWGHAYPQIPFGVPVIFCQRCSHEETIESPRDAFAGGAVIDWQGNVHRIPSRPRSVLNKFMKNQPSKKTKDVVTKHILRSMGWSGVYMLFPYHEREKDIDRWGDAKIELKDLLKSIKFVPRSLPLRKQSKKKK